MSTIISVVTRKHNNLLNSLQKLLPNLKFHQVQNPENDEQFKQSQIIIGDNDLIGPMLYKLPNTKWMQCTMAGVDNLLVHVKPNEPPPFVISRFSGKHFGKIMSEYVVANIINFERDIFRIKENQKIGEWITECKIENHRTIDELKIGILGLGAIGDRSIQVFAQTLNYLGATVYGYGRKPSLNLENYKHIAKYYNRDNLPAFLKSCDYFINLLPNTEESKGLLNGNVLENCKEKDVIFINIGRGTIISEICLVNALEKKWIAGAILDVFESEPLRKDSPLWNIPNVFITPHVAGVSRSRDIAEQFSENLKLYEQKLPIPMTIDFSKGY